MLVVGFLNFDGVLKHCYVDPGCVMVSVFLTVGEISCDHFVVRRVRCTVEGRRESSYSSWRELTPRRHRDKAVLTH